MGSGIARQLAADGNDVTVIDVNEKLIQHVEETLDVRGVVGHGSHPEVLERAGAADAEMLIAVTYSDEVNMIATQIAHTLFQVPKKIARVRAQAYLNPAWQSLYSRDHMPIDEIISPEMEVGRAVLRRLRIPGAFETIDFAGGLVKVLGVRARAGAAVIGKSMDEIHALLTKTTFVVVAINRGEAFFVPSGSDRLEANDDVYLIVQKGAVADTLDQFGYPKQQDGEAQRTQRVVIVGGGNIGVFTAVNLEKERAGIRVKLIEQNKEKAEAAAQHLERTVVLVGSGLDQGILREAGVPDADTVVAVTNDDEVNILTALTAKKLGAQRTITLINNPDYRGLLQSLDIAAYLDPRATTVSTILQHVRRGRIKRVFSIGHGAGEVIEAEALDTSPLSHKPLKAAKLPTGIIIGAVLRKEEQFIMPSGDFEVQPGDRVIVFALRDMVRKVEQLFRVSIEYF